MQRNFWNMAWLGIVGVLSLRLLAFASDARTSPMASDEPAVRSLILRWVDAYKALDAKRIAALETPDVHVVDRFGVLHAPSGRSDNEELWLKSFEAVARNTAPPEVTVERIRFIRPDVAIVQVSWRFPDGILLVDGDRIPPFSETDTFVVVKSHDIWSIAAHNIQEKRP